jgi:hypothetical protein
MARLTLSIRAFHSSGVKIPSSSSLQEGEIPCISMLMYTLVTSPMVSAAGRVGPGALSRGSEAIALECISLVGMRHARSFVRSVANT